jgi:hypothetical protein
MIQTLGDVLLLVAIVSLVLVSFLLAVFFYHLIFVVMDLRQVMRRLNDITAEIEELLMKPVEVVAAVMDWAERVLWDMYGKDLSGGRKKKKKGRKRKRKKGG